MSVWTMRRESRGWVGPVTVQDNGVDTNDFDIAVVPRGRLAAAADWRTPDVTSAGAGIDLANIAPLPAGESAVLVRVDDYVIEVGQLVLTE